MFITRLLRSRRHLSAAAIPYAPPVVEPGATAPAYRDEAAFVTRRHSSRRHQWASALNQHPTPTPESAAPYPSFAAPKALHTSFARTPQRLPEHNEYPYVAPISEAPIPALFSSRTLRRKPQQGLFLTPSDYIEADVVQPIPATLVIAQTGRRLLRRRTRRRLVRPEEIDFVEKVPPAGEEFEPAWRAVITIRRLETGRDLQRLLVPVISKEFSPGWKLATAFRRIDLSRTLQRLPTLSFFLPKTIDLPAYQAWPTLRRRDISYHTWRLTAPEHVTLRVPPDSQGFPAFMAPQRAFFATRKVRYIEIPLHAFATITTPGALGQQPPHYVIGRMTQHGAGLIGTMTVTGLGVDGTMTDVHTVDGSFDPSEGHGGSVL